MDTLHELLRRYGSADAVPVELTPARYRYRCLPCLDKGVELFRKQGDLAVLRWARPCPHCPKGDEVLASWKVNGPYRGLNDVELAEIRSHSCEHDCPNIESRLRYWERRTTASVMGADNSRGGDDPGGR